MQSLGNYLSSTYLPVLWLCWEEGRGWNVLKLPMHYSNPVTNPSATPPLTMLWGISSFHFSIQTSHGDKANREASHLLPAPKGLCQGRDLNIVQRGARHTWQSDFFLQGSRHCLECDGSWKPGGYHGNMTAVYAVNEVYIPEWSDLSRRLCWVLCSVCYFT